MYIFHAFLIVGTVSFTPVSSVFAFEIYWPITDVVPECWVPLSLL